MPSILIVEKLGAIKKLSLKTFNEQELYKKAGFKTDEGFSLKHTWTIDDTAKCTISLYGKTTGRAGQENKFEFPPPVDSTLYFGNCLLVKRSDKGEVSDLTTNEWEDIYEALYGGFEDIGDDDSDDEEDEEDDIDDSVPRTKDGYVKDGFIVDGDDEEIDDEDEDNEEEEEDEDNDDDMSDVSDKVSKKKSAKKSSSPKSKKSTKKLVPKKAFEILAEVQKEEPDAFLDCTSELSEEEYIE